MGLKWKLIECVHTYKQTNYKWRQRKKSTESLSKCAERARPARKKEPASAKLGQCGVVGISARSFAPNSTSAVGPPLRWWRLRLPVCRLAAMGERGRFSRVSPSPGRHSKPQYGYTPCPRSEEVGTDILPLTLSQAGHEGSFFLSSF